MYDDIKDDEWIDARQRFSPPKSSKPRMDMEVSRAVGFEVRANDPRVIRKVAEWRRNAPNESSINNNYLRDPKKVEELKKVLR